MPRVFCVLYLTLPNVVNKNLRCRRLEQMGRCHNTRPKAFVTACLTCRNIGGFGIGHPFLMFAESAVNGESSTTRSRPVSIVVTRLQECESMDQEGSNWAHRRTVPGCIGGRYTGRRFLRIRQKLSRGLRRAALTSAQRKAKLLLHTPVAVNTLVALASLS